MKVAVVIATYCRTNGKSPAILHKMFGCLLKQTHKNFKVFIVGDDYTKKQEFINIINQYNTKLDIYYKNNPVSLRNNCFKLKMNCWTCGGILARYEALKQAIAEKYDVYMHLDDDDIWLPNHIKNYVNVLRTNPRADFIYSKANYKHTTLPRNIPPNLTIKLNNFNQGVKPANVVHSSFAFNLKTTKNLLITLFNARIHTIQQIRDGKIEETRLQPFDATQLAAIKTHNKNCILIPQITCKKIDDVNIPT